MIKQYRKKPVVIQAFEFYTNNQIDNINMNEIVLWCNQGKDEVQAWHNGTDIFIKTPEGEMRATVGDFIIKGVNGEFYPCKPDIFEKTYELVDSSKKGK